MKKTIAIVMVLTMVFAFTSSALAYAEKTSVPCYMSILEAWNAKDGKELETNILEYWRTSAEDWATRIYTQEKRSMTFRLGGTTKELIADLFL